MVAALPFYYNGNYDDGSAAAAAASGGSAPSAAAAGGSSAAAAAAAASNGGYYHPGSAAATASRNRYRGLIALAMVITMRYVRHLPGSFASLCSRTMCYSHTTATTPVTWLLPRLMSMKTFTTGTTSICTVATMSFRLLMVTMRKTCPATMMTTIASASIAATLHRRLPHRRIRRNITKMTDTTTTGTTRTDSTATDSSSTSDSLSTGFLTSPTADTGIGGTETMEHLPLLLPLHKVLLSFPPFVLDIPSCHDLVFVLPIPFSLEYITRASSLDLCSIPPLLWLCATVLCLLLILI